MIIYTKETLAQQFADRASILVEAMPFIHEFSEKIFVVKIGGEIADEDSNLEMLAEDLLFLKSVGVRVVLCHGGGPQITKMMKQLGCEPEFIDGLRVTDEKTLQITKMVLLGDINQKIVAVFNKRGPHAVGLTGSDGSLFTVRPRERRLGFVGEVETVKPDLIDALLNENFLPVVACLGSDTKGQTYNLNADIVAAELARQLVAEKLLLLTNVEGLYENFEDKDSLISQIDSKELERLAKSGALSTGMIPKVNAVLRAVNGGVPRAHILDGRVGHTVLVEVFTSSGTGTMIVPSE